MNLHHDVTNLRAADDPDDAFIVLSPGDAFVALCICMALGWLLATVQT